MFFEIREHVSAPFRSSRWRCGGFRTSLLWKVGGLLIVACGQTEWPPGFEH